MFCAEDVLDELAVTTRQKSRSSRVQLLCSRTNPHYALKGECSGICKFSRLGSAQYACAKRLVGTDLPRTDLKPTQMDRAIVYRHVDHLVAEGHVKVSSVAVHTSINKRKTVKILNLPEISENALSQFIMGLSERLASTYTGNSTNRKITVTEHTEAQVPVVPAKEARAALFQPGTNLASDNHTAQADVADVTSSMRRSTLLSSLLINSEKNARIVTMYRAISRAFNNSDGKRSILSPAHRAFSLDMLFSEITVSEWYQCVSCSRHADNFKAYLRDPATNDPKIRNVLSDVRPSGCFKGQGTKHKFLTWCVTWKNQSSSSH